MPLPITTEIDTLPDRPSKGRGAGSNRPSARFDSPDRVVIDDGWGNAAEFGDCRWPFGDPRQAGFRFCCRPRAEAGYLSFTADPEPYCEDHRLRGRSKASAAIVRPWRGAV